MLIRERSNTFSIRVACGSVESTKQKNYDPPNRWARIFRSIISIGLAAKTFYDVVSVRLNFVSSAAVKISQPSRFVPQQTQ